MPAPLMTWSSKIGPGVLPASNVAGCLQGMHDLVAAHVAANPLTALWTVASFQSTSPAYLVLKPTAVGITAGATSTARIILFGGTSPNAAAIDSQTANTTTLYIGVAPEAGVDTPDQSYATGAPFTTGPYAGCALSNSYTSITRVHYWETYDGIAVAFALEVMTGTAANLFNGWAGKLAVDIDGETARWFVGASFGTWAASNQDTSQAGVAQGQYLQGNALESSGAARATVIDENDALARTCRLVSPYFSFMEGAQDGARRIFYSIAMRGTTSQTTRFKMRQIAYGMRAIFGATISDANGVAAHKLGASSGGNSDGPWLCNFRV